MDAATQAQTAERESSSLHDLQTKKQAAVAAAKSITDTAIHEKRSLTKQERDVVERQLAIATDLDARIKSDRINQAVAGLSGPGGSAGLFAELKSAGWAPGKKASVPWSALGTKTASFTGSTEDLNPSRREGAELGFDRRYLHEVFPSTPIDGSTTQIQTMRQSSRTLPDPADVTRALTATTAKAEVTSTRELVNETVQQLAAIESDIPNLFLTLPGFRSMVDQDLRLALLEAAESATIDAIEAANPEFISAGGNLLEQVRYGISDMQLDGYSPNILAISPGTATAFDLMKTSGPEEFYVWGPSRQAQAWNLSIVVAKELSTGYLIDTSAAGRTYQGPISLDTFEENDGQTNTSTVRLEGNFLATIERAAAIRELDLGS